MPEPIQPHFVLALIAMATVMMATNRVRYDFIALLVLLTLMLSGVLTVSEALSGFGNSVVILIAGLFIVGEMLDRTGVARYVGDWIQHRGGQSETRLLAMIMVSCALLSAVMSSTAVIAIFIPIAMRIARRSGISPSRIFMPMAYAALVSGMLTLIATPPNLIASAELQAVGFKPLGFFSFSAIGLVVLVLTLAYVLLLGKYLLPGGNGSDNPVAQSRTMEALWQDYQVERQNAVLRISNVSPIAGCSIADSGLFHDYRVRILGVIRSNLRGSEQIAAPPANFILHAGDLISVAGRQSELARAMSDKLLLKDQLSRTDEKRWSWELGAVTLLIHPDSRLPSQSIKSVRFRDQYRLEVFGLRRNRQALEEYEDTPLMEGDSLLVLGSWNQIKKLQASNNDFVVLEMPQEFTDVVPAYRHLPIALCILGAMVLVSLTNWIPLVAAVIIAAIAAVTSRCLSAQQAYGSIHWTSLVLLAGMLPLAEALNKTGGTTMIVNSLLGIAGNAEPDAMLTLIFFITAALTTILSNTAAAVLMAPIAVSTALTLGVSPYPMAVTVIFAASSAFLTPVASPVVTLVVEPGRYHFFDFVKLGAPLLFMVYAATYFLVPLVFPW